MSDYVIYLDRDEHHSTTACSSAHVACEQIDERRGEGWKLETILRNDRSIDESALRLDAVDEIR